MTPNPSEPSGSWRPPNQARWESLIWTARRRLGAEKAAGLLVLGGRGAIPVLYLLCLFAGLGIGSGRSLVVAGTVTVLLWWGAGLVRLVIPGSRREALHALDRNLGFSDLALAGDEVGTREPSPWGRSTRDTALAGLEAADWARSWPLKQARPAGALAAAALPAFVLLPLLSFPSSTPEELAEAALREQNRDRLSEMYELWEEAAREHEQQWAEEEWADFGEYLEQARAELPSADEDTGQRELLRQFHRTEARLGELAAQLPATGLEEFSGDLANRTRQIDGWQPLASDLESGRFRQTADELDALAQHLSNGDSAELPALADEELERWEETIEELREAGHDELAEACELLCEGLKEGDAEKAATALSRLGQLALSEAFRQQQEATLAQMQRQLQDTRESMARGEELARAEDPRRSLSMAEENSEGEGSGIGSGASDDLFGESSEWTAEYFHADLEGSPSEDGESETRTISLEPSGRERTAAGSPEAGFDLYEELSRETIENEDIPLAHRETVRRYFQSIRPDANNQDDE